jgi:predicted PurR-regulated permease PerM
MLDFNARIKQVIFLSIMILLIFLIIKELTLFLPGILGAVTLYILSRANYFQLVFQRKWKKGWAAGLFIFYYLILLGLPIFFAILLVGPKVNEFMSNPTESLQTIKAAIIAVQKKMGFVVVSEKSLSGFLDQVVAYIPTLINSTATLITNLALMLFILYNMLYSGRDMEKFLSRVLPLKPENVNLLAAETKNMIKANALGIPLISIIQGAFATIGYLIFGVDQFALWGFATGIFAFFPVVGTMVVWIPLVLSMYAGGQTLPATGLLLYSLVVTGNVDYLARITLLKKIGNVNAVITILGVIVGLGLFGFIGLIFGPLLVNYVIVLFDIYMSEFVPREIAKPPAEAGTDSAAKT